MRRNVGLNECSCCVAEFHVSALHWACALPWPWSYAQVNFHSLLILLSRQDGLVLLRFLFGDEIFSLVASVIELAIISFKIESVFLDLGRTSTESQI